MFAVVDAAGAAVSFGSVLTDPLPVGLSAIEIDHPPGEGERWDPATRAVVPSSVAEPDISTFYRAVAEIFGGGGVGASRLYRLDRDYPGIDRNLRDRAWDVALAGVAALLQDAVVTQEEYDAIQAAWDAASLGRPASE